MSKPNNPPPSSIEERAVREEHLAYTLRSSKTGPETRSAVVGDQRFDFFRGKDFEKSLSALVDILDEWCPLSAVDRSAIASNADRAEKVNAARMAHIGGLLLHRGYIIKCERVFKDPRKGRTKLVKFPRYLIKSRDQSFSGDGFYAWQYSAPMSWASVAISGAVAVGVVLMCLFPLAPIWFKKVILYVCLAILGTFAFVFTLRAVVFGIVWIVLGEHFWILPNLTDDEIPINELFTPPWAFDRRAKRIGLFQRILGLSIGGGVMFALYRFAPETGGARVLTHTAHDAILDLFNLKGGAKSIGTGGNTTTNATTNETTTAAADIEVPMPEMNLTETNATTNATVIPSLDEILAEVGDLEFDEEDEAMAEEATTPTTPRTEL